MAYWEVQVHVTTGIPVQTGTRVSQYRISVKIGTHFSQYGILGKTGTRLSKYDRSAKSGPRFSQYHVWYTRTDQHKVFTIW